ncbi:hypothetical protein DFJ74DRAFT_746121 [Hyaloraphidium curvatum]|nr:hypothetical protein DFJ74DRAFT_746121 [Hyaloraphidium curvatum]
MAPAEDSGAEKVANYIDQLLRDVLAAPLERSNLARLSVALGLAETALTGKDPSWPADVTQNAGQLTDSFNAFVDGLAPAVTGLAGARDRVRHVADALWSRLSPSPGEALHAQHLSSLCTTLLTGPKAKARLDCAGIGTAAFLACRRLAAEHGLPELAQVSLCVTEDHCFLSLDGTAARESSCEVATDSKPKRGLAVAEDAWAGWLYQGGRARVCTPAEAACAAVVSTNPSLGKNKGVSWELRRLQIRLLRTVREHAPDALYPGAAAVLASLEADNANWRLGRALDEGDPAAISAAADPGPDSPFARLLTLSEYPALCYPLVFAAKQFAWRAELLLDAPSLPHLSTEALDSCLAAARHLAVRLASYPMQPYMDALLLRAAASACEEVGWAAEELARREPTRDRAAALLELLDGACGYAGSRVPPVEWTAPLLRAFLLFPAEIREEAAKGDEWKTSSARTAAGLLAKGEGKRAREVLEAGGEAGDGEGRGKRARRG